MVLNRLQAGREPVGDPLIVRRSITTFLRRIVMSQSLIVATTDYPVDLAISAWLDAKVKLSNSAAT
jgi:hypothetical protein